MNLAMDMTNPFLALDQHPPEAIAAIDDAGEALSYGELNRQAAALAGAIPAGSLIFILCENSLSALIGYVACLSHHIVPLLLDSQPDRQLLERLIATYHPGWLWRPQADSGPDPAARMMLGRYELVATGLPPFPLHPSLALLVSTSGSTGSPRLVRLSAASIEANAQSIARYLAIDKHERAVVNLPMHYVYGLSIINSHLLRGATLLLTSKTVAQRAFWQFVQRYGGSSLAGVPYTYQMLQRIGFMQMALPTVKTLTQAGGKLSPALHQAFARYARQHHKAFIVMYGAAEATARMAWLPAAESLTKCGSIGQAIPGGRLVLLDAQGRETEACGQTGELVYYGPNVMLGYAQCGADLSKGDELQGRLVTGDIARRDEAGFFSIVGRKSRFAKLFGRRIALDELEMLIRSAFPGAECACLSDDRQLRLFMEPACPADEIKRFICQKMRLSPSAIVAQRVTALPRSASGKILYRALEACSGQPE